MNSILLRRRRFLRSSGALALAVVGTSFAAACSAAAAKPMPITVHKDPSCGCCGTWAERMNATGKFAPSLVDHADMSRIKAQFRVPPELASCHTTEVKTFIIEGHVPAADILRLLDETPRNVIGLAVPGMPAGSPGMEMSDSRRDPYEVVAFRADGSATVFARYS